jgi:hypothetical protein
MSSEDPVQLVQTGSGSPAVPERGFSRYSENLDKENLRTLQAPDHRQFQLVAGQAVTERHGTRSTEHGAQCYVADLNAIANRTSSHESTAISVPDGQRLCIIRCIIR